MSILDSLYFLGIWSYRQMVRLASVFGHKKARKLNIGLNYSFRILQWKSSRFDRHIWVHAASLGEFEQARPLIEKLRREHPRYKIVLTFYSPSGYEVRKDWKGADIIAYLPFDTPENSWLFLEMMEPEMAIFVKYEFWPNYLRGLKKRNIPTYLISGVFRPDQLFFKSYGGFYRKLLDCFTTIYVQDNGSRKLLEGIGVKNTVVAGDTRFDRVTDIMQGVKSHPVLDRFCGPARNIVSETETAGVPGGRPVVFMAGSSWPADEAVYSSWLKREKSVKGVIAPHEFDEVRLKKMLELFDGEAILLSDAERNPEKLDKSRILIIDCFGLLSSAYAYADIAYIGGGFGAGLHNINEAAVFGVPVVYGPNHSKFIEAEEMKTLGGGLAIDSRTSFERIASRLAHDPIERARRGKWAADYIQSKIGATDRIYSDISRILKKEEEK